MFEMAAFYFFAISSLIMFAVSVFSKNILYAMTSLAGGMIFVSGLFFILEAEFIGVVQIMVYTGAVIVLYGFSMMFFDSSKNVREKDKSEKIIYTLGIISAFLIVIIMTAPVISNNIKPEYEIVREFNNIEIIGLVIFTKYLIVFELAAVMLLVAMIGAIALIHKNMDKSATLED